MCTIYTVNSLNTMSSMCGCRTGNIVTCMSYMLCSLLSPWTVHSNDTREQTRQDNGTLTRAGFTNNSQYKMKKHEIEQDITNLIMCNAANCVCQLWCSIFPSTSDPPSDVHFAKKKKGNRCAEALSHPAGLQSAHALQVLVFSQGSVQACVGCVFGIVLNALFCFCCCVYTEIHPYCSVSYTHLTLPTIYSV